MPVVRYRSPEKLALCRNIVHGIQRTPVGRWWDDEMKPAERRIWLMTARCTAALCNYAWFELPVDVRQAVTLTLAKVAKRANTIQSEVAP